MDPYDQWFLTMRAFTLLPAAVPLTAAIWLLIRWGRKRRRVFCLLGGLLLVVISLWFMSVMFSGNSYVYARLSMARELSLPPPAGLSFEPEYVHGELLARITPGRTTREEVHRVMSVTQAGYECPKSNAEKYLFYENRYQISPVTTNTPEGVNVYYREDGVVARLERTGESIDLLPSTSCSWFSPRSH